MSAVKITDSVYWAGALLPSLRKADVIVDLKYGTTINAYLVKGSRKRALIDTSLADTVDEFRDNLRSLSDLVVDYIIVNHAEPDHSGALPRLMERFPGAEILATPTAAHYLKRIVNKPMNIRLTRDEEELDLGGLTLRFLHAPFLHWPDTMMTYCPEEKILFPCDFLGAHFCEPRLFSDLIQFTKEYDESFKNFYTAIMSPFKGHVLAGLDRIKGLPLRYVCPSHGPVLVGDHIGRAMTRYRDWSAPKSRSGQVVSVFYASAYGCTAILADQIARGIRHSLDSGSVNSYDLTDTDYDLATLKAALADSDAFLIGSPTVNRDATAPAWQLLAGVDAINSKQKRASAFGSFGWSGEAVPMLIERLKSLKFDVQDEGFRVCFVPTRDDVEAAYEFGKAFGRALPKRESGAAG